VPTLAGLSPELFFVGRIFHAKWKATSRENAPLATMQALLMARIVIGVVARAD
jgi:hypothetical protein